MNSFRNTVLLLTGALVVSAPVFAQYGADDAGTSGTSGVAGSTGTSGTAGTAGTSGTTSTAGTSGSFGAANLNQKVLANFNSQLLIVPCIDVKNSTFDGHYNVVFGLSGDNSGNDWSVKEVRNSASGVCSTSNASTDDVLQTIGLASASSSGTAGTSGVTGANRKIVADFSKNLLVMPCVDVRNSAFNGYYHVVLQLSGDNSGSSWKLKAVNSASALSCGYNEVEDINDDRLLQANGHSSVAILGHR